MPAGLTVCVRQLVDNAKAEAHGQRQRHTVRGRGTGAEAQSKRQRHRERTRLALHQQHPAITSARLKASEPKDAYHLLLAAHPRQYGTITCTYTNIDGVGGKVICRSACVVGALAAKLLSLVARRQSQIQRYREQTLEGHPIPTPLRQPGSKPLKPYPDSAQAHSMPIADPCCMPAARMHPLGRMHAGSRMWPAVNACRLRSECTLPVECGLPLSQAKAAGRTGPTRLHALVPRQLTCYWLRQFPEAAQPKPTYMAFRRGGGLKGECQTGTHTAAN
eukprot:365652-Chlamydomonas_euryale.AAC.15